MTDKDRPGLSHPAPDKVLDAVLRRLAMLGWPPGPDPEAIAEAFRNSWPKSDTLH
jgi:hypothetical protein